MAKFLVVDEFHLTISAPRDLAETEYSAIRRTLDAARFQAKLRRAIRIVCSQHADLRKVRITLSR